MRVEVIDASALVRFENDQHRAEEDPQTPVDGSDAVRRLSDFLRSPLEICDVDHGEALALALAIRLTAYDASYLWLARQRRCGLVTLDRQLALAAQELPPP